MAQRMGLITLAAMTIAVRSGFASLGGIPLLVAASVAQMIRTLEELDRTLRGARPVGCDGLASVLQLCPQPEEPGPVPPGARDQDRDFGEVCVGFAVMGKPFRQHCDAVALALPFPHQDRAGVSPAPPHDLA